MRRTEFRALGGSRVYKGAIWGKQIGNPGLSNEWTVKDFYPIEYLPRGVRLTAYHGEAADLSPEVLEEFLEDVAAKRISVPIHRHYTLDDIVEAHTEMEAGSASGKIVIST